MAVLVLTLLSSLFIAGGLWLSLGSRFNFSPLQEQNEWLNFAALFLGSLPVSFVLIFFGLGGL